MARTATRKIDVAVPTATIHRPEALKGKKYTSADAEDCVTAFMLESLEVLLGIARDSSVPVSVRTESAAAIMQYGSQFLAKRKPAPMDQVPPDALLQEGGPLSAEDLDRLPAGAPAALDAAPDVWTEDVLSEASEAAPTAEPDQPHVRPSGQKTPTERALGALERRGPLTRRELKDAMKGNDWSTPENWAGIIDDLMREGKIVRDAGPNRTWYRLADKSRALDA